MNSYFEGKIGFGGDCKYKTVQNKVKYCNLFTYSSTANTEIRIEL